MDILFGVILLALVAAWLVLMGWFEVRQSRRRTNMLRRQWEQIHQLQDSVMALEWAERVRNGDNWPHTISPTGESPYASDGTAGI